MYTIANFEICLNNHQIAFSPAAADTIFLSPDHRLDPRPDTLDLDQRRIVIRSSFEVRADRALLKVLPLSRKANPLSAAGGACELSDVLALADKHV